jgi:hypothetical protein
VTSDLLSLKRRWLPLFIGGVALFGAGLALLLLWIYRSSPLVGVVVGMLTTPARGVPPRGSLVSLTALVLTTAGGALLAFTVRRINASEIGEIDSFWWKVAIAALAGRWWLGEPRVVVAGSRESEAVLPVLRSLKTFTGQVIVLLPPDTPQRLQVEAMAALAEDEQGVRQVIDSLEARSKPLDPPALSGALRLRGRIELAIPSPRLADAIARADAIVVGPAPLGASFPGEVLGWLRASAAKKVGLPAIVQGDGQDGADLGTLAGTTGALDAALVNSNTVPALAEGQRYLIVPQAGPLVRAVFARDVVDWADPSRHDPAKLEVFLREVILRD